jgi:hypothetical protein
VQWASVPLAIAGLKPAAGFVGRFLRAWGLVSIVGIAISLATGIAPADRFVTFGFVVPVLAALGVVRLWDAIGAHRAVAIAAAGGLTVAMLAGAWIAWDRQEPFVHALEIRRVTDAGPWLGSAGMRTALVFPVNDDDPAVTFLATRAANVIRAGVPPIGSATSSSHPGTDRRGRRGAARAHAGHARGCRPRERRARRPAPRRAARTLRPRGPDRGLGVRLALAAGLDRRVPLGRRGGPGRCPDVAARAVVAARDRRGDARSAGAPRRRRLRMGEGGAGGDVGRRASPAVGAAATAIASRSSAWGLARRTRRVGALASALAGASGYALWLILERRARARPTP